MTPGARQSTARRIIRNNPVRFLSKKTARSPAGGAPGFSLLELVVVLAIFTVVALIGVQVIAQVVRADRRLAEVNDTTADLAYGLALLRADLDAAIGLSFHPPNGLALPALDAPARQHRFALSLGGQATLDGHGPARIRVIWRLNEATGAVTRQVWPSLIPGDIRLASPEVVIFEDVEEMSLEGYEAEGGWTVGFPKPDAPPDRLPAALRVTLRHETLDRLQTLVTLR